VTTTDREQSVALEVEEVEPEIRVDLDAGIDVRTDVDAGEEAADDRRWTRLAIGIVVAFVVTRLVAAYVADHPLIYGPHRADGTGDVHLYDYWSWQLRHTSATAYHSLHIEYPPGALPFMFIPRFIRAVSYRTEFITLMVIVDALGLLGLVRLARRTGAWWGVAA
jgi:hypothetical protein